MDDERASDQIDSLMERRSGERNAAGAVEDSWDASVKRDKERRVRGLRAEWYAYHVGRAERLRRTMTALVERHEAEALKLMEDQPERRNA